MVPELRTLKEVKVANLSFVKGLGDNLRAKSEKIGNKISKKLTTKKRKRLPDSAFVFPKERKYPIHDKSHARNALARVAQHGTPSEKKKVRSAVRRKYPGIDADSEKKSSDKGIGILEAFLRR